MSLMSLPELWNTFTRIQRLHCHRKLSIKKVQFFFLICVCTCVYIYIYIRKKYIYTHIHTHLMVLNYITEVIMLTKMVSTLNLNVSQAIRNTIPFQMVSFHILLSERKRKFKCWNSNSAFDRGPLHPTLPHCHLFTVHHPLECYHHLLLSLSAQGLQSSVSTCRFQPLCSCYLPGLARDAF